VEGGDRAGGGERLDGGAGETGAGRRAGQLAARGLRVDGLRGDRALRDYHLLPSVRGELLTTLGRADEARAEYARAAELATNEQERALLRRRAAT